MGISNRPAQDLRLAIPRQGQGGRPNATRHSARPYDGSARRQTMPRPPERPQEKSKPLLVWNAHVLRTRQQRVFRALATASLDGWEMRPDAKAHRPTASLDGRNRHFLEPPPLAIHPRRPIPRPRREATQIPGKGSST